jgi:hypothetical protein
MSVYFFLFGSFLDPRFTAKNTLVFVTLNVLKAKMNFYIRFYFPL